MKNLRQIEESLFNKVNPAIRFSVGRYVLSIGLFVGVVVFGLVSLLGLGVDLFPSINIPVVVVATTYTGATPSVVDQQVTQVIENAVSTISGITDMNASSSQGSSRVILSFDISVNKDTVANEVATQVSAAAKRLPANAGTPLVRTFDPNSQPILQFGISGGSADLATVSDYANNVLAPYLERVDGVANVQIDGGPTRQFQVLLNPNRLAYYNVTPQAVVNAITSSAVNQPIGNITTNANTLSFATQNTPTDVNGISQILVDASKSVTVGNLGTVRESSTANDIARVNGKPVVLVSIQQTATSNAVAVAKNVRKAIAVAQLPANYTINYSNDTTLAIQGSVDSTYRELYTTAIVVAFIVLLFLGRLNTAFSVILAIPIALSAAPVLYNLMGFSLNLISLLALIVAIGIVVDDSIVVAENVERRRALGEGRMEAVLKGASEVFSAVAASSLSLLSVLLPVSFIGGIIGKYIQQFTLGLAAAVFFSWFEALLFLTVRMAYTPDSTPRGWQDFFRSLLQISGSMKWGFRAFRKPFGIVVGVVVVLALAATRHFIFIPGILLYPIILGVLHYLLRIVLYFGEALTATLHGWTEKGLNAVRSGYTRSLSWIIPRSKWVLVGAGLFLVASAVLVVPHIPFNFVPQSDNGNMEVHVRMPSGTATSVTNAVAGRVEDFLLQLPTVETVQTVVGGGFFGGGSQADFASLNVQLTPITKRPNVYTLISEYRPKVMGLVKDYPSARVFISAGGGFRGQGSSFSVSLISDNLGTLTRRSARIVQALQNNPYVADVSDDLSQTSMENDFVPNQNFLSGTGLTASTIASALNTYTTGTQAANVNVGGQSYPINVQVDPKYLTSEQSLLSLPLYSPTLRSNLQIGQLGSFVLNEAPLTISRYNRLYTDQVTMNLTPNAPPALKFQQQIQKSLTDQGLLGNGVTLSSGSKFGPAALAGQLSVLGPIIFLLAIFLAYLVMGAQFNSFRYPIYLLLPVPLALIGALWSVFLFGGGIDIFGALGMLMLIGLSAKNAIIYLDFVVERLGKMAFVDALIDSARLRFRPIIMTTLTVLVISFPLIFEKGLGSEYAQRLGIVLLGGILSSAILTFFVVPAAFYVFERKRPVHKKNALEEVDEELAREEDEERRAAQPEESQVSERG